MYGCKQKSTALEHFLHIDAIFTLKPITWTEEQKSLPCLISLDVATFLETNHFTSRLKHVMWVPFTRLELLREFPATACWTFVTGSHLHGRFPNIKFIAWDTFKSVIRRWVGTLTFAADTTFATVFSFLSPPQSWKNLTMKWRHMAVSFSPTVHRTKGPVTNSIPFHL